MPALTRTPLLVGSVALGILLMLLFARGLLNAIRRAMAGTPPRRGELFGWILGIVIGAWFFTFGGLSIALGFLSARLIVYGNFDL